MSELDQDTGRVWAERQRLLDDVERTSRLLMKVSEAAPPISRREGRGALLDRPPSSGRRPGRRQSLIRRDPARIHRRAPAMAEPR